MIFPGSAQEALDGFVAPLVGQPVWGAKQGYGSFLNLEFCEPRLIVKEWISKDRGKCRHAYVQGRWTIWIYCCEWRFFADGEAIAWSEDSREDIARATGMMDGQKLTRISVNPASGKSSFVFDLGGLLETWPVGDDPTEEQWFVYGPEEVFGYRADGAWSRQVPQTLPEQENWHSAL